MLNLSTSAEEVLFEQTLNIKIFSTAKIFSMLVDVSLNSSAVHLSCINETRRVVRFPYFYRTAQAFYISVIPTCSTHMRSTCLVASAVDD